MEIINFLFVKNVYLWFHILMGGVGARIINHWKSKIDTLLIVFFISFAWEIYEMFVEGTSKVYGTTFRWALDSIGDIIGAVFMAFIVLYEWRCKDCY